MQRLKVVRALRGIGFNPFQLSICEINNDDLQRVKTSVEGMNMVKQIELDNKLVFESLGSYQATIAQRSGNYINMEELNDFTREILKDMTLQINLLKDIGSKDAKARMCRVFRCAFLIAELEGNLVISYEEAL